MRFSSLLILFFVFGSVSAQFQFRGQVSHEFRSKNVFLSLVEDYRKTSRVHMDQIFQTTVADSLGYFSFEGNHIPNSNRMYRIHVDACDKDESEKKHFLGSCTDTESILFIAKNGDTLSLPVGTNQQAFCEVISTNPVSGALLELDELKEELVISILGQPTEVAETLTFKKWIQKFQEASKSTGDPLVELYGYDFLSSRENDTHEYYLENLKESKYYEALGQRLAKTYPNTSFTGQFQRELKGDIFMISEDQTVEGRFEWGYLTYFILGLAVFLVASFGYLKWKRGKNQNPFDGLSPQERKVLNAILDGKSNKEIAADFFISLSTVKSHINSVYKKLDMSSRDEILAYYKGKR